MLNQMNPTLGDFKPRTAVSTDTASNVFKVLHGFYGNLFLSKFVNGQTGDDGVDQGVISAKMIWAHGLRDFDRETIKTALTRVMQAHPDYPPNFPQFAALCKAAAPRAVYQRALPAPSVDNRAHAQKARELLGSIRKEKPTDNGLDLLKQAIADAVRCAGGDEGATLARLDKQFKGVTV